MGVAKITNGIMGVAKDADWVAKNTDGSDNWPRIPIGVAKNIAMEIMAITYENISRFNYKNWSALSQVCIQILGTLPKIHSWCVETNKIAQVIFEHKR